MEKSSQIYRLIDRLFENALIFNLNQIILDGGKNRQIKRFLADIPYQSMVDIGCGTGNWAALADGKYLGVDTSPSFIASCKKRYKSDPRKEFLLADATSLALSEPFDLAILVSVLHSPPRYGGGTAGQMGCSTRTLLLRAGPLSQPRKSDLGMAVPHGSRQLHSRTRSSAGAAFEREAIPFDKAG